MVQQVAWIQKHGGIAMILPLRWLLRGEPTPEQFVEFYSDILRQVSGPVLLHWLGPAFHPDCTHYFPGTSLTEILNRFEDRVRGVKFSLLEPDREIEYRRARLHHDQVILTGDDFHFPRLIAGETTEGFAAVERWTEIGDQRVALGDFSHALLGIFDGIALPASHALRALQDGQRDEYERLMGPCEAVARRVFVAPTSQYKAGLAFLAWLNGLQSHVWLAGREDLKPAREYFIDILRTINDAGLIQDPNLTVTRGKQFFQDSD